MNKLSSWLEDKVQSFLQETVDTIVGHHQDALQKMKTIEEDSY